MKRYSYLPKILLRKEIANSFNCRFLIYFACIMVSISASYAQGALQGKFEQWKKFTTEAVAPLEVFKFFQKNPDWPQRDMLVEKAETALTGKEDATILFGWFNQNLPITPEGALIYANLLLKNEKKVKATQLVKKTWLEKDFSGTFASTFRSAFKGIITAEDDVKRVNRLLYKEKTTAAKEMLKWLNQTQQDIVKVRLELLQLTPIALQKLNDLKVFVKNNEGLIYEQVKWYRRQKMNKEAFDLLSGKHSEEREFADEWWQERNILARRFIEEKRFQEAFQVIQGHQLQSGENFANAEWLGGWLRLRFIKKPQEAYQQFENLYNSVGSPISRARAAFWAAEALKALGKADLAIEWYKKSADHPAAFYGQLSRSRLQSQGVKLQPISFVAAAKGEARQRFEKRELVRVIKLLPRTEKEEFFVAFFLKLSNLLDDQTEQGLLVELAGKTGSNYAAVQVAKKVSRSSIPLTIPAYPLLSASLLQHTVYKISKDNQLLNCLAHAIIRQESRFNPKALSPAGAQGLMQLMPQTALQEVNRVKRAFGVNITPRQSTYNPAKNVLLGTAHIKHLLEEFQGSAVLAIAAYNAGKKAVGEWISLFGDPRQANTDIIDWIELIPYAETRNYVQRVMENFIIYKERVKEKVKSGPSYDLAQYLKISLR